MREKGKDQTIDEVDIEKLKDPIICLIIRQLNI